MYLDINYDVKSQLYVKTYKSEKYYWFMGFRLWKSKVSLMED